MFFHFNSSSFAFWRLAIMQNNAGVVLAGPLGTAFSEVEKHIPTSIQESESKNAVYKWRPVRLGLSVLSEK